MSNFMKILPVKAELWTGGRRDKIRLIAAFRNFANAHKITTLGSLKGSPKPKLQGCRVQEEEEEEGEEEEEVVVLVVVVVVVVVVQEEEGEPIPTKSMSGIAK
jgi:hypothetical protein